MNLSGNFKMNSVTWTFKTVPEQDNELDGDRGKCFYRTNSIVVSENLHDDQTRVTLFHELAHAALHETGYNEEIRDGLGAEYERFVTQLGMRMFEVVEQFKYFDKIFKDEEIGYEVLR